MRCFLSTLLVLCTAGFAPAQIQIALGSAALDFPPGPFSDNNSYTMSDFRGKVVVLFFFEKQCPTCKGTIPARNAIVQALKDKPVKFVAIGPGDTLLDVVGYQRETQLAMPIFADSLGLMEKRYGFHISLQNIYQIRVYDPVGKLVGVDMAKDGLEKIVEKTKPTWKYKGDGYDAKLNPALDQFEFNQYAAGMKLLTPLRKNANKAVAESANKLFDVMKKEGTQWKEDAEAAVEDNPVKSYDLYAKITAVFAGDELAKSVADPLKKLGANKTVSAELAARKAFAQFTALTGKATPAFKPQALKLCQDVAKKHAGTPTGDKAGALADELSK
jgi:thiol-disulfide isomerase/thioredoxin